MKKKIAVIIVFLLIAMAAIPAAALNEDLPDDVVSTAEQKAMPYCKSFMKNPNAGFIGTMVESAEEIDTLTLGQGMMIYGISDGDPTKLSDRLISGNYWCFSMDKDGRKVATFEVFRNDSGELHYQGIGSGAELDNALSIMERLADEANVPFEPKLLKTIFEDYVILQAFGEDERVILLPLDDTYSEVKNYRELPTGSELLDEIAKAEAEAKPGYYGAGLPAFPAHPGVLTGEPMPETEAPETEAPAAEEPKDEKGAASPLWYIIPAAAVIVAAVAVIVVKKKKKS